MAGELKVEGRECLFSPRGPLGLDYPPGPF